MKCFSIFQVIVCCNMVPKKVKLFELIRTQIIPLSFKENDYLHSDLDLVHSTCEIFWQYCEVS